MRKSGTVVRIKGKFYARWTVSGERVYGEARDSYDEADRDRISGKPTPTYTPPKKKEIPTFQAWCHQQAQGDYGASVADSTHETNETIRLQHVEGTELGKARMDRIDRPLCVRWAKGLTVKRTKKDGEKIRAWRESPSVAYQLRVVAYASKMMSLYVQSGGRIDNPFSGIGRYLPKLEERENRTLSPQEAIPLLNPVTRTDAVMLLAMATGMRRGEIIRLEWKHIGKGTVRVPGTKSRHARRVVPLPEEAREAIYAQPKRSHYVFTTEDGKPLSPRNLSRDVNKRKVELGIPAETRLHDLRGSYASLLVEQGEDPRKVMEMLGHADPRTTLKLYARSRNEQKERAVETMFEGIRKARNDADDGTAESASG